MFREDVLLYRIEWTVDGLPYGVAYADNGPRLDLKVREVFSLGFVPTITVETKPDELDSSDSEIKRSAGHTS